MPSSAIDSRRKTLVDQTMGIRPPGQLLLVPAANPARNLCRGTSLIDARRSRVGCARDLCRPDGKGFAPVTSPDGLPPRWHEELRGPLSPRAGRQFSQPRWAPTDASIAQLTTRRGNHPEPQRSAGGGLLRSTATSRSRLSHAALRPRLGRARWRGRRALHENWIGVASRSWHRAAKVMRRPAHL